MPGLVSNLGVALQYLGLHLSFDLIRPQLNHSDACVTADISLCSRQKVPEPTPLDVSGEVTWVNMETGRCSLLLSSAAHLTCQLWQYPFLTNAILAPLRRALAEHITLLGASFRRVKRYRISFPRPFPS